MRYSSILALLVSSVVAVPATGAAQSSQAASAASAAKAPVVGDVAPDFSLTGATRFGVLRDPLTLASLRGQTVVLAFFPGARTPGCTIQMEKYRDRYAELFPSSKVVVLAVSVDADTTLAAWAHDAGFPMVFASDVGGKAGSLYGAYNSTYKINQRYLYVIGPDGKIVYTATPFNVSAPASYTDLGAAVKKTL